MQTVKKLAQTMSSELTRIPISTHLLHALQEIIMLTRRKLIQSMSYRTKRSIKRTPGATTIHCILDQTNERKVARGFHEEKPILQCTQTECTTGSRTFSTITATNIHPTYGTVKIPRITAASLIYLVVASVEKPETNSMHCSTPNVHLT